MAITATAAAYPSTQATDNDVPVKIGIKLHEPELNTVERWAYGKQAVVAPVTPEIRKSDAGLLSADRLLSPDEYRRVAEASKTQRLDSIIGYLNNGNDKYTRQLFTYDGDFNPVMRTNSYWNASTQAWDDAEFYEYKVDDDGYVLEQSAWSAVSGQRYRYEYDEKKRGIVMELWEFDGTTWSPIQRGDYKYDDRDNMTEEVISAWNASSESWVKAVRHFAEYDEHNRQINYEPYEWNGNYWYGVGEKKTYEWTEDGTNYTCIDSWIWEPAAKQWFNYCRYEKDFDENGNLTRNEKMFYNKDLGNWAGAYVYDGYEYHNTKSTLEYDELGRLVYEVAYEKPTVDDYIMSSDITYTWTDLDDGGTQCVAVSKLGYTAGEPYVNDETTEQFDANGNRTLQFARHINISTMELVDYQKITNEYDESGNVLSERQWVQGANGMQPYLGADYQYNSHNMVTDQQGWKGQSRSDEWVKSNHFTYAYEQDTILVDKKCYRPDGDGESPSWGDGNKFDYDVPVENIVLWPGGVFYHKLVEQYSYSGNGNNWDVSMMQTYYYSDIIPTAIGNTVAADGQEVALEYDGNVLRVNAEGDVKVNIYGVSGMRVIVSSEKVVDISSIPSGVYVVEVNGHKEKILKR